MKYIKKGKEPESLANKRQTDGAIYEAEASWQVQLLEDQGYLCAYCMGRISLARDKNGKPRIEIEHYLSKKLHPSLGLVWKNMLGVCNGTFGMDSHCDKTKGKKNEQETFIKGKSDGDVMLNILDPLNIKKSERIVTYSSSGEILLNTMNPDLEQKISEDLNYILNLNDDKLKQARKNVMDVAKEILTKKHHIGTWSVRDIDREISDWSSKTKEGRYKAYCQAAIWFLESRK
jgi:uncharacterized protein (TIGR02646 family)